MYKLANALCKLACYQLVHENKFNICVCHPFCKLLNNLFSTRSSIYSQGPYVRYNLNDCKCNDKCKYTNTSCKIK